MAGEILFLLVLVVAVVVGLSVLFNALAKERVRRDLEKRGGRATRIAWSWGWNLLEQDDRVYDVEYVDAAGLPRKARAKTRLVLGDVYWSGEAPGHADLARSELETLRHENARLRAEVERLRRGEG